MKLKLGINNSKGKNKNKMHYRNISKNLSSSLKVRHLNNQSKKKNQIKRKNKKKMKGKFYIVNVNKNMQNL